MGESFWDILTRIYVNFEKRIKNMENSEWLDRKTLSGIESGISRLLVLRTETVGHWWEVRLM